VSWGEREARWRTYALRSRERSPLDVEHEGVARLFVVRIGVVALWRNTATVEARKADVDPLRIVLRWRTKESERVARDPIKLIQG
jgi:hypothetical protein